jgi:hypothetical protein
MSKLTDQDRRDIKSKLASGVSVSEVAKQYKDKVSIPTLYNMKKSLKPASATDLVRQAISQAEHEIGQIEKQIKDAERLREELKAKKAFLESLKKIEAGKSS